MRHWCTVDRMVFVESAVFTRRLRDLLSDDEYEYLQRHLALNPTAGAVIQDTGGLRKVRWAAGGGKRGGGRVIYFHAASHGRFGSC